MPSSEDVDSSGYPMDPENGRNLSNNNWLAGHTSFWFHGTLALAVLFYFVSAIIVLSVFLPKNSTAHEYELWLGIFTLLMLLPWAGWGWSAFHKIPKHRIFFSIITLILISIWNFAFLFPSIAEAFLASSLFLSVQYIAEGMSVIAQGLLVFRPWLLRKAPSLPSPPPRKSDSGNDMTTDNRLSPVSMERFGGLETSTHVEPFNTTAPSIPDATNLFDQGSALPSPVGDFDERRFSAVTTTSSRSSHFWQNERGETAVGQETQEKNPRDSMMTVQSTEQGDGDSESFRRFRDTLGSVNTFTSLPSYRTQPSAPQTPYDFQLPPLPALPTLPLPPPSAFTSARISRQLSPTTSRSNDPPPSYSL